MMTINELCRLLDANFRRGTKVDNKAIIELLLSLARVALQDEGMLELLQEMEAHGGAIPWAYDATGLNKHALEDVLCDKVNGRLQWRYYNFPIDVCGRTYYISSQWYSHEQYPQQSQTKKALLQLICHKLPRYCVDEYLDRLAKRANLSN